MRLVLLSVYLLFHLSSFAHNCKGECAIELQISVGNDNEKLEFLINPPSENYHSCDSSKNQGVSIETYNGNLSLTDFISKAQNNSFIESRCSLVYDKSIKPMPLYKSESSPCVNCQDMYDTYLEVLLSFYDGNTGINKKSSGEYRLPTEREFEIINSAIFKHFDPSCSYFEKGKGFFISSFPLTEEPANQLSMLNYPVDIDINSQLDNLYIYIYSIENHQVLETIEVEKYNLDLLNSYFEISCNEQSREDHNKTLPVKRSSTTNRYTIER